MCDDATRKPMARTLDSLRSLVACTLLFGCEADSQPQPQSQPTAPVRVIDLEPPDDRERSPYTGWTRAHHEAVFGRLLLGFVDHRSPDGARTRYAGGEQLPAAMEGAVRMLPALEAWLACACNPERVRVDGREIDVAALARDIVVNGTDPRSRDYWHPIGKGWDQRKVEAAMVASILVHARERVWDRLDAFEQIRVMNWLRPSDDPLAANWLGFQLARDSARLQLGWPADVAAIDRVLDLIEADYQGDGFYRDGGPLRFDWYNAFVIHPQLLAWRHTRDALDARHDDRATRLLVRTRSFLGHLPYLMDERGAVAPIGRSLAYRSAVMAALVTSIVGNENIVEPGLARRMVSGNLRHHLEAGMFDADSVLTRGYHGEQPDVLESYVRPGSQYFFSLALGALALAPDHPFWTAQELPLPADEGDFVHAIPAVGWMIDHDRAGGGLVLHNTLAASGRSEHHERYRKLAYAPAAWFAVETAGHHPYDASFVSADAGRFDRRRSLAAGAVVAPGFAWQRYTIAAEHTRAGGLAPTPHWISTAVITPRFDDAQAEPSVRVGCIVPSEQQPARAYLGSLAMRASQPGTGDERGPWWLLQGETDARGELSMLLAGLHGWTRAGLRLDFPGEARHVLGGEAAWIGLGVDESFDSLGCFASLEQLAIGPIDVHEVDARLAAAPRVVFDAMRATLDWPDGGQAWIELAATPSERALELGPVRLTGPLRMAMTREHEGVRTLVAIGVRSVADARGPWIKSTEPRTIACELQPTKWRCEVDGPLAVALEHVPGRTGQWAEPLWLGRSAGHELIELHDDGSGWAKLAPPGVSHTTMRFEIESSDP